ncbi:MAG: prenyltransferase, partial [Polyangiales bacterium]
NHAAYFATGVWHLYCRELDARFLAQMWPAVDSAMRFVLAMQLPNGAVAWAQKNGKTWAAPLLTGSSSVHGSMVCAIRIADRLGHDRPEWRKACERLARVLRHKPAVFTETDLPEKPGRHSMDWYYPVLGGALRGELGRKRLLDGALIAAFVEEGVGCRCVKESPWYTIAETCELALALHACGLTARARDMLAWTRWLRGEDGAYFTGATHPERQIFPEGEQTSWTAAAVLIASDAVQGRSATSDFFRSLSGDDLHAVRPRSELPQRPAGYDELRTAAE